MFPGAQVQRLAALGVAARHEAFPVTIKFRDKTFIGNCTSFRNSSTLQDMGFSFSHDALARIPLSAIDTEPQSGEPIAIQFASGFLQQASIKECRPHPTNPEWRVGLSRL